MIIKHYDNRNGGNLLVVPSTLRGGILQALSSGFPGKTRWQNGTRNLIVRVSGENISALVKKFPDAEWDEEVSHHKDTLQQVLEEEAKLKAAKYDGELDSDDDYQYKRAPMDHQRRAFLTSRNAKAYGWFMEQGTGKTKVTIDNACYLFNKGEIEMLIVIAWPNGVHRNWVDNELPEDVSVPYVAAYWSAKTTKKFKKFVEQTTHADVPRGTLRVMTYNVEAFSSSQRAKESIEYCLKNYKCMLAIDQSASIKTYNSKRTEYLIGISALAKYRRILDGAPVAEGAEELYSQFYFLNPWIIGHDTWTAFKNEYCLEHSEVRGQITGYRNMDKLYSKIDPYSFRALADDCLDLPPRIYKKWEFDLTNEERRIYDDLRKHDLAFFDKENADIFKQAIAENKEIDVDDIQTVDVIEENLAMIKVMRMQQIASGWFPVGNPESGKTEMKMINEDQPTRLKELLLLLSQNHGQKAIIFSRFRPDLDILQKVLGNQAVSYHGGIKEDDRAEAKRRFQEDPNTLYFIGQPRNAGIGHTLTAARHVIFYSNDSSLRFREECEKRAHRTGLKNKLIVWDLLARRTGDANIMTALRNKKRIANEVMRDPHTFFLCHE